ncbi:MAG TPA: sialidase family protein [Armatimonadota bacterium]|nr:sialidase family protein [Armatimonadota bacterium]
MTVPRIVEWRRSQPDFVVYLPRDAGGTDAENQHLNVVATPSGSFLAFWTQATEENAPDQRVVVSRSTSRGNTWSPPSVIDGAQPGDPPGTGLASWEFPIIAPGMAADGGARVYCFYNKNVGINDAREDTTGVLRVRYSDDDGLTWSDGTFDYPVAPNALSNPDLAVPPNWIVYQTPGATREGHVLAGFTRWASDAISTMGLLERSSEVCFLRFENILSERDPARLVVTTWPRADHSIRIPAPGNPEISVAQEPSVQVLSDGRLICVMRALTGMVHFALSEDDGRSWGETAPLCREPGGKPLLNPIAPCPLYRFGDGRFLLIFYNNDGSGNGGSGPTDYLRNRTPAYCAIGKLGTAPYFSLLSKTTDCLEATRVLALDALAPVGGLAADYEVWYR